MLLTLALNWMKTDGVPKLQETLLAEFGTKHRSAILERPQLRCRGAG